MIVNISYNSSMNSQYNDSIFFQTGRYSCKNDVVAFYDEISNSVFCLNTDSMKLDFIVCLYEIAKMDDYVVLKPIYIDDCLVIIPEYTNMPIIKYNIKNYSVEVLDFLKERFRINDVVDYVDELLLVPGETTEPIIRLSKPHLCVKSIDEEWYVNKRECWGVSVYNNRVAIPIINEKSYYLINENKIIDLNIDNTIFSISLCDEGVWILPTKGNEIYYIYNNNIEIVPLVVDGIIYDASAFLRVVNHKNKLFLFPSKENYILIYRIDLKIWTVNKGDEGIKENTLYHNLPLIPYWGFFFKNDIMYLLPYSNYFAYIDEDSKMIRRVEIMLDNCYKYEKYISWIKKNSSMFFIEKANGSLKEYINNLLCDR